jgi:hypothetical protein
LTAKEKERRRDVYQARMAHIVVMLQETATSLSWEKFSHMHQSERPVTIAWWLFLRGISPDKATKKIIEARTDTAQLVLGGPLTREELLMLPANWKGVALWGVYVDILTGEVIENQAGMELYTGSGTGEKGLEGRLSQYASMQAETRKRQDGPHCDLLMEEGVKVNFRVVSMFRPERETKPYLMLSDLAHTIL